MRWVPSPEPGLLSVVEEAEKPPLPSRREKSEKKKKIHFVGFISYGFFA